MTDESSITLNQRGAFSRLRQFALINGRQLRITLPAGQGYSIDVLALAPAGRHRFTIPWPWLALLLLGVGASVLTIQFLNDLSNRAVYFGMLATGGLFAALGALMFFKGLVRWRVFVSRHAHVPLLSVLVNQPDRKSFRTFIAELEQAIASASAQADIPKDKQIAGETRMLRRLSEEGVLTPAVYEQAKTKLLGHY